MFLKGFFYMPRSDRRTFTFLCTLILFAVILMGIVSNMDDTSNKIDTPEKAVKTKAERYESKEAKDEAMDENKIGSKLFYFDPNTADSTQLLQLGLRPWQVRNI